MKKENAILIDERRTPDECQTAPICPEFSLCLVNKPDCRFASLLGSDYVCKHPNHRQFVKICRNPPFSNEN